jgi:hypothetical protein
VSNARRIGLGRHLAAGMVAGAAGTAAMDLLLYQRYRRDGGKDSHLVFGRVTAAGYAALTREGS